MIMIKYTIFHFVIIYLSSQNIELFLSLRNTLRGLQKLPLDGVSKQTGGTSSCYDRVVTPPGDHFLKLV